MLTADQLAAQGRYAEALEVLGRAIEENPTLTSAYVAMGEIHLDQNDAGAAEQRFRQATLIDASDSEAHRGLGDALVMLERFTEAVRSYLRALRIRPNDARANAGLASSYLALDEPMAALPFAERARALEPAMASARATLAGTYAALGRHTDAVREYEAALELEDLEPDLLLGLAESLGRLDRYQEMANTLRTAISITDSAAAHERLGFAHFKLRQYTAADASFRRALQLEPEYFPALNGLGVVLLNDYLLNNQQNAAVRDEAMGLLRRSLRQNQSQPRISELVERFG